MTDSEAMTTDQLTIRVRFRRDTIELFSVPLPRWQQLFISKNPSSVRVLENPLEESLRHYVAWGRLTPRESRDYLTHETKKVLK